MSEEKKKVNEEDLEQINGGWSDDYSAIWFHYNKPEIYARAKAKGCLKEVKEIIGVARSLNSIESFKAMLSNYIDINGLPG